MRRLSAGNAAALARRIGAQAFLGGQPPVLATIILTDLCNLSCRHCAVNNRDKVVHPFDDIVAEMRALHAEGVRILFFCGGETTMWSDGQRTLSDLVDAAWDVGFFSVVVVTNGTITLALPRPSLVLLSLDGLRPANDAIRGEGSFDAVMRNLDSTDGANICVYSAINTVNLDDIEGLCRLAAEHPAITAISFNLHTPYPGTESLALSAEQKRFIVEEILRCKRAGLPVFNLDRGLERYLSGKRDRPCPQCIVSEAGKRWVCGRCIDEPGLCEECGYLFAVEYQLLFSADPLALLDAARTYTRYL